MCCLNSILGNRGARGFVFTVFVIFSLMQICLSAVPSKKFRPPEPKPAKTNLKATHFGRWLKGQCPPYQNLVRMKNAMITRITKRVDKMAFNMETPEEIRKAQIDTLMIFMKELNETDILLIDSFKWLDQVMRGDYNDFVSLKKSSEERLNMLRDATLKEEQEYQLLAKAGVSNKNKSRSSVFLFFF